MIQIPIMLHVTKLKWYAHKNMFEYAGGSGFLILTISVLQRPIFEELEEDKGNMMILKIYFWATGACLFIRKDFQILAGLMKGFLPTWKKIYAGDYGI